MLDYYQGLVEKYPLVSIEDPFAEEDWGAWQKITAAMGDRLQFVGDDLLVTNPKRLQKGIDMTADHSLLVKPNQIAQIPEPLQAIKRKGAV